MNKPLIIGNHRFLPSQKLINDIAPETFSFYTGNDTTLTTLILNQELLQYQKIVMINIGSQPPLKWSQTTPDVWT